MATISKVIGFATQYYTLWNYAEIEHYKTINGKNVLCGITQKYTYIQNLSKDEEEAIKKVAKRYKLDENLITVDEGLRGIPSKSFERYLKISMPYSVFPYGKLKWMEISESDDVWQLEQVYKGDRALGGSEEFQTSIPLRRRALARRKLIELGELIRFDHLSDRWDDVSYEWIKDVPTKYMSKRDYTQMKKVEESYFLHTDKEKVELNIREIRRTGYDTAYGFVSIVTYENEVGDTYIYKGSTVPYWEGDVFAKVKATIKHEEYKGVKQTLIQRVKVI